jgi:uncharacterized protein (TIGR03663 family)
MLALGATTFAIRLVPALCGIATVLLAFGLRRWIGAVGALTTAALLAVSPGAVYFSRYFIHEALLVGFTFAAAVAAWQYIDRRRVVMLLLASASAAMMFATKETWIITAGVMAIAAAATVLLPKVRRAWDSRSPRAHHATSRDTATSQQQEILATERLDVVRKRFVTALASAAVFVAVSVALYSSFFNNWDGVVGAIRGLAIWTGTGTREHVHSWDTYVRWLVAEEAGVLVIGLIGSGFAIWNGRHAFVVFSALWAIGTLLAYSLIPYKTPWLALNVIVPLAIVSGWVAETVYIRSAAAWRRGVVAVLVLMLGVSSYQAITLNFVRYDDDRYPYVYAHSRRELLDLVNRVERIRAKAPLPVRISVVAPEHFPLSWYLKDYPAGYYGRVTDTKDEIFIGAVQQDDALRTQLGDRYVRGGQFPLRPGVDLVLYVRRDLAAP